MMELTEWHIIIGTIIVACLGIVWLLIDAEAKYDKCMVDGWQSKCAEIMVVDASINCNASVTVSDSQLVTWTRRYCMEITGYRGN